MTIGMDVRFPNYSKCKVATGTVVRREHEAQALMFGLKTLYMYTNRTALVVSVLFYIETTSK